MTEPVLTPEQRAAVEDRGGSLLVSAAAGSGKTKVLVDRIFRYVTEERCCLDDFLVITYTKAAAAELRGKIASELSRRMAANPQDQHLRRQLLRVYQADIKTVDAFCVSLLRENTHLLAREEDRCALTPDFRVLDESDAQVLRRRVLERTLTAFYEELDEGRERLADTLGAGRDDRALASLVLEVYGKLQSHASPEAWLERNRRVWQELEGGFDGTVYARELLDSVRRRSAHWSALLWQAADRSMEDEGLRKGYEAGFRAAAACLEDLAAAETWEDARGTEVVFGRVCAPRGRKDEPETVALKSVWEGAREAWKDMAALLDVSGEEAMEDLRAVAPAMLALLDLTAAFAGRYRAEKLRMNAADFSDQEHLALRLLVDEKGNPTELGLQTAGRYREILVDEYQDTNEVQNAIFRAVSREGKNLFTVGDVKQSIYRFRLADPTIFLEKYQRFRPRAEAAEGEERKILLSRNFRSRREILDGANFLFENILSREMGEMDYGPEESLHFGAEYYPERRDCATEFHLITARRKSEDHAHPVGRVTAEARFTAERISQLLEEGFPVTEKDGRLRPCRPGDIVVLMRAPGSRAEAFSQALAERGIPCSFDQREDFFHTLEISVMVALLDLVDNPRQDVPLISVLRSPLFAFSADRLASIRSKDPAGDFYDAVAADGGEDCRTFLELLSQLRQAARDMSVHRLIWHIYNRLNVLGIFGAMEEGAARRENLIALSRQAERLESGGCRGVFAFVTQLHRLLEADEAPEIHAAAVNGVRLMSIHKSKGLEFPIVILADLDHAFSRQDFNTAVLVHPSMGLGPRFVDLERRIRYPTLARQAVEASLRRENLAEEQRVLYVAMTRPKEKLILIDALYNPEKRLKTLCAAAGCPAWPESVAAGTCYGDWILLPLLCRPEAEPLRALAGSAVHTLYTGDTSPWEIYLHDGERFAESPAAAAEEAGEAAAAPAAFDPALLEYVYPWARETALPAKVTATQLKGRPLDREIEEQAAHVPYLRPLVQPKFRRERRGLTPAERGTATHLALQYLDFSGGSAGEQLADMVSREMLTPEQAEAIDCGALDRFLRSPLAEEIRRSPSVLREYRFTLLMEASAYDAGAAAGEELLLQGVVDCCFEGGQGLTVVDFKTDRVATQAQVRERAEHYRPQLEAYTQALERVLERPVKRRVLVFLDTGATVEL